MNTDHLQDLILLAEACGLTRSPTMYPGVDQYAISEPDLVLIYEDGQPVAFQPRANFRHAGMLMRAMAIALEPSGRGRDGWHAWKQVGSSMANMPLHIDGNTEPAQCSAVCECALKILRERK